MARVVDTIYVERGGSRDPCAMLFGAEHQVMLQGSGMCVLCAEYICLGVTLAVGASPRGL